MTPEQIKERYEPRILKILNRMRDALTEAGHDCDEPFEMSDESYRWELVVNADEDHENGIDVSLTICESEHYDGSENGVNFMVDVVEFGGRMLGGLCPYNYSNDVWVDRKDADAIEDRFSILEQCDVDGIVKCVAKAEV